MIFNIGDTLLNRYTLTASLIDKPGLAAWQARDRVLAEDCQLFLTTKYTAATEIQNLASWLGATRNQHFTAVQHLHCENNVCVIVTDKDAGISLSDYIVTDNLLSIEAIRSIIGEVATAASELQQAGFQHRSLTAEFVRLSHESFTIADLPISPLLTYPYLGLSSDEIMHSSQASVLRQLGMLLYLMITRMPYIPGQTRSTSTLDAAQIKVPEEFRILCMRTLGLKDKPASPTPVPVVTIDEFLALLGPWKPASSLTEKDIILPSIAVSESVQGAQIERIPQNDLALVPKSIQTFDASKSHGRKNPNNWQANARLFEPDQVENISMDNPTDMYKAFGMDGESTSDSMYSLSGVQSTGFDFGTVAGNAAATSAQTRTIANATEQFSSTKPTVPLDVSSVRSGAAADAQAAATTPNATGHTLQNATTAIPINVATVHGSDSASANTKNAQSDAASVFQTSNDTDNDTVNGTANDKASDAAHSESATTQSSTQRRSIIPSTQPIAITSAVPNMSLAHLESKTTQYQEAHYHHRPVAPPAIQPENPNAGSRRRSRKHGADTKTPLVDETSYTMADSKSKTVRHRVAVISMISLLIIMIVTVFVLSSGLFDFNLNNTTDHAAWPSDLPAAGETSSTETMTSAAPETTTTTPTPTNTVAYTVSSVSFLSKPNGLDGYAYVVSLSEEKPVSKIVLTSPCSGGTLYIYANGDAQNPQNGQPVATGTFDSSGETTIVLNNTTNMTQFVIWVNTSDLPTGNRLKINGFKVY